MAHIAGLLRRRDFATRASPARSSSTALPLEDRRRGRSVGGRRASRVLPAALPAHAAHHRAGAHARLGRGAQRRAARQRVVRGRVGVRETARHVFDISPAGVAEFQRRGVIGGPRPTGIHAVARGADAAARGRPRDRRAVSRPCVSAPERVLCPARRFLQRLQLPHRRQRGAPAATRPRPRATGRATSGCALVASSRIVLCVHSTERPYFEQHRAMLALANGCLLVTESSQHTEPLEDGVHFASAALDELPALCRRYLTDPSALDKVATAGHEMAIAQMPIRRSCAIMLDALQRPAASTTGDERRRCQGRGPRATGRRAVAASRPATRRGRRWPIAAYSSAPLPAVTVLVTLFNYRAVRDALPRQRAGGDAAGRRVSRSWSSTTGRPTAGPTWSSARWDRRRCRCCWRARHSTQAWPTRETSASRWHAGGRSSSSTPTTGFTRHAWPCCRRRSMRAAWRRPTGTSPASTTRRGKGLDLMSSLDWSPTALAGRAVHRRDGAARPAGGARRRRVLDRAHRAWLVRMGGLRPVAEAGAGRPSRAASCHASSRAIATTARRCSGARTAVRNARALLHDEVRRAC